MILIHLRGGIITEAERKTPTNLSTEKDNNSVVVLDFDCDGIPDEELITVKWDDGTEDKAIIYDVGIQDGLSVKKFISSPDGEKDDFKTYFKSEQLEEDRPCVN